MNEKPKIVGTFTLDGMIQGEIPPEPAFEKKIREWVARQKGKGLGFEFATDGNNFNLLPDNQLGKAVDFAPEGVSRYLGKAYQELVDLFPARNRTGLFSTLRSIEYIQGNEIQTVYLVKPPGKIQTQQRTVESETLASPSEPSQRRKAQLTWIGMALGAFILILSSFFIDWRLTLFQPIGERLKNPESIPLENEAFREYFLVMEKKYDSRNRQFLVSIAAGPRLKSIEGEAELEIDTWTEDWKTASLQRKTIACLYYDKEGELRWRQVIPFEPNFAGDPPLQIIRIPMPSNFRPHRLVLWPS